MSTVTLAELLFGIAALPGGKRKANLAQALDGVMDLFRDRVLSFDIDAARRYADLAVAATIGCRNIRHRSVEGVVGQRNCGRLLNPPGTVLDSGNHHRWPSNHETG